MKKRLIISFFIFIFPLTTAITRAGFIQRSHTIFFPKELGAQVSAYQSFPVFWWNFYVIEGKDQVETFAKAQETCQGLRQLSENLLMRVECGQALSDFREIVLDWAQDTPLRRQRPGNVILKNKFSEGFAKASFLSSDRTMLEVLRNDPLETWKDLKNIAEEKLQFPFERTQGFFFDPQTQRIVIPIQLAFPPTETYKTRELLSHFTKLSGSFIGAHSSTLQNEAQVNEDLNTVSWVGIPILALLALYLLLQGRWQFFMLIPVVFAATGLAALVTYFMYGGIHGLTLSFGSAVVGLALDYGFHGSLNHKAKHIWQSNLWGYFTTLLALLVLMCSSIPLMRQLMVFSSLGLSIAYVFYYVLIRKYPNLFAMKAFKDSSFRNRKQIYLVFFLLFSCFSGFFFIKPQLSMAQFDFQAPETKKVQNWLFQKLGSKAPLFRIVDDSRVLEVAEEESRFSKEAKLRLENISVYLPSLLEQKTNIESWNSQECTSLTKSLSEAEINFYKPFLDEQLCSKHSLLRPNEMKSKAYLKHLSTQNTWVTVWFPQNDSEINILKNKYPELASISELIAIFPRMLSHELYWMIPTVLLLTALLLCFYYRNIFLAVFALLPFLSGTGMIFFVSVVLKLNFSFISLVGLVMVYGFSLDYGIFATDQCLQDASHGEEGDGVWSTLRLSSLTTIASFVPFLFCKHPVLVHLGQSLFLGAIGTYVGAIWGVRSLKSKIVLISTRMQKRS